MRNRISPSSAAVHGFCALLALMALVASACLAPVDAQAEVNRCTTAQGIALYTDRRCTDLGAVPDRSAVAGGGSGRFYRGGCARNVQDLMYEVTTAIDSGDVNRLAAVYHWTGMSGRAGYAVMSRLGTVVRRPLIDIVPITAAGPEGEDAWLYPQTTVDEPPVALRLEQTRANSATPSRTVFGMHRHFGCYWLKG
ncbi:MAG: hypothetical protein M3Q42_08930 [Pseudomonadota bacterium]|nr:hypothetical protein [Pseudomonadota bacterium]